MDLFFHEVEVESDELQIVCLVILPENATKEDIEEVLSFNFPLKFFTVTITGNKEILKSMFNKNIKMVIISYKLKSDMIELVPFSELLKIQKGT